jgi:predicted TIM-barrel fold metal-dependent hydrolase
MSSMRLVVGVMAVLALSGFVAQGRFQPGQVQSGSPQQVSPQQVSPQQVSPQQVSPQQVSPQQVSDYHQHLLSPAVARLVKAPRPFLARDLIPLMDSAGVQRAVILSLAYQFGNPNRAPVADEYTRVKAENDWTSAQVALFPERLIGFCGVDPLRDYAVAEIDRCSRDPHLRAGLKLHFGNSDVDLDSAADVARLQRVFRAADQHGMAIAVHLHANIDHHRPYGAREARVFLTQLMPSAPHVVIQIAHLAGAGGYDDATDEAVGVFVAAIQAHDPAVRHLWFDVSSVAGVGDWESRKKRIALRIEEVGVERVLYGTDGSWAGFTPAKGIAAFRRLPLTSGERRSVLLNLPPYGW